MMQTTIKVAYLPHGSFVLPILSAIHGNPKPDVASLARAWSDSELSLLGASLSTKITMLSGLARRLYTSLSPLVLELGQHTDLERHLAKGASWIPSQRDLPYEVLIEFDAYLFEFRSAYEILGKFMRSFSQRILGVAVTEKELMGVLEARGISTEWAVELKRHRIFFFHDHSPWLAFRLADKPPFDPEPVFLMTVDSDPGSAEETVSLAQLSRIYSGFDKSLRELQSWAIAEIAKL